MKIISVGEILWDVFESGEHLGGAPFNFAAHARRLGHEVLFVSAVGDDARGQAALARMKDLDLPAQFVHRLAGEATGTASVSVDPQGQPCFVIHRPVAYDQASLNEEELAAISSPEADWIYFGTLHLMSSSAQILLRSLLHANPRALRFYDINLRPRCYDAPLVKSLLGQASVVKMNDEEVGTVAGLLGERFTTLEEFCRIQAKSYGWKAVCVTRGAAGCSLLLGEEFVETEGYHSSGGDAVGAGDAFAAAFLHGFSNGWRPAQIGDFANRVGALVASRSGAIPLWTVKEVEDLSW